MGLLCSMKSGRLSAYTASNHTIFPRKKRGGDGLGAGKRQAVCPAGPRCRTTPPAGKRPHPGASEKVYRVGSNHTPGDRTPAHRGRGSGFADSGTAATAPRRIGEGVASLQFAEGWKPHPGASGKGVPALPIAERQRPHPGISGKGVPAYCLRSQQPSQAPAEGLWGGGAPPKLGCAGLPHAPGLQGETKREGRLPSLGGVSV